MRTLLKLLALLGIGLAVYTALKSGELYSSTVISAIFAIVFAIIFFQFSTRRESPSTSTEDGTGLMIRKGYNQFAINSDNGGCDGGSNC